MIKHRHSEAATQASVLATHHQNHEGRQTLKDLDNAIKSKNISKVKMGIWMNT